MFTEKARSSNAGTRRTITLVEAPHRKSMFEKEARYDVYFAGTYWGDLYFNARGYQGYLPSPSGALDIGEQPIGTYRRHVRELNRQWAEAGDVPTPVSPMARARGIPSSTPTTRAP